MHLALEDSVEAVPFVDLDSRHYKVVDNFDQRFPSGVPSMRKAEELVVKGDWTFGANVAVVGRARLEGDGGRVEDGSTIGG